MSIILQDTFTRANVASGWGTATDGNVWTTQTLTAGTVQVASNKGQASNVNAGSADLTLGTTTSADGDVTFRFTPSDAGDDAFAIERFQSAGNFYYLGQDLSGVEALKKRVAGSGATLTSAAHTLSTTSSYWVHAHVQGSTLSVRIWVDGTTEPAVWDLTVTDTTYTTAGKFGNHLSTATAANTINVDNFSVDNLAGHSISGRSRSKYLTAMAINGPVRARFVGAIASFGRLRSKFTESIASRGVSRAKFTESIGSTGRIRAKFVESQALKGRIRSRFYEAAVSKGLARAKFAEAIAQKSGARSKFLLAISQKAASRSKFVISKAIKGLSRSSYLISKASKGLARSKFTESITQKGQARSKFSLSTVLKGLAESTFKIAVAGGHAITSYMRSKYRVSIRQTQVQRSKFLIRFSQSAQVHSRYLVRFAQAAQSRTRFLVRFGVTGRARSRYFLSIRQTAIARSRFITRLALAAVARSKFLVHGIVVIYPIKSITHAVYQALSAAWNVLSALGLVSSHAPALTITHQELAMPAPNSTILPTITVTDISGALVSNASAVSLVVYFPDGTTSNYSLTSGITNLGAGQYQAKYNTKQSGEIREVWSIIGADGTTLASAQFLIGVEY